MTSDDRSRTVDFSSTASTGQYSKPAAGRGRTGVPSFQTPTVTVGKVPQRSSTVSYFRSKHKYTGLNSETPRDTSRGTSQIFLQKMGTNNRRQMGSRFDSGGSQIRASNRTSVQRCKRNKNKTRLFTYYTTGGKRVIAKTSDRRSSSFSSTGRFLQYTLPRTQQKGRSKVGNQSETSERLSQGAIFQDGQHENSAKPNLKRRFCNFDRFQRHSGIPDTQKVPKILCSKKGVSIHRPTVRAQNGPKNIQQGGRSSCSSSKKAESETCSVFR